MADLPAFGSKQGIDPAVAVPPVLARETQHVAGQGIFILTWLGDITYGIAGNAQRLADAPRGVAERLHAGYRLAPARTVSVKAGRGGYG